MTLKVIVAGSRGFDDFQLLSSRLTEYLVSKGIKRSGTEIVSGTANGADRLGEKFANGNNVKLTEFPADWSIGKQAGFIRNWEMAKYADVLFAFHDGVSKGTKHMIDLAHKEGLEVHVIKYQEELELV